MGDEKCQNANTPQGVLQKREPCVIFLLAQSQYCHPPKRFLVISPSQFIGDDYVGEYPTYEFLYLFTLPTARKAIIVRRGYLLQADHRLLYQRDCTLTKKYVQLVWRDVTGETNCLYINKYFLRLLLWLSFSSSSASFQYFPCGPLARLSKYYVCLRYVFGAGVQL